MCNEGLSVNALGLFVFWIEVKYPQLLLPNLIVVVYNHCGCM